MHIFDSNAIFQFDLDKCKNSSIPTPTLNTARVIERSCQLLSIISNHNYATQRIRNMKGFLFKPHEVALHIFYSLVSCESRKTTSPWFSLFAFKETKRESKKRRVWRIAGNQNRGKNCCSFWTSGIGWLSILQLFCATVICGETEDTEETVGLGLMVCDTVYTLQLETTGQPYGHLHLLTHIPSKKNRKLWKNSQPQRNHWPQFCALLEMNALDFTSKIH